MVRIGQDRAQEDVCVDVELWLVCAVMVSVVLARIQTPPLPSEKMEATHTGKVQGAENSQDSAFRASPQIEEVDPHHDLLGHITCSIYLHDVHPT